eukprot:168887_1
MATRKKNLGERFKSITKKNATTLTFGEKTSKISATDAVTTLLDRSDTKTEENVYDVINAFSSQINRSKTHHKSSKRKQASRNRNRKRKKQENIEYLNKKAPKIKIKRKKRPLRTLDDDGDNSDINTLEASSNAVTNINPVTTIKHTKAVTNSNPVTTTKHTKAVTHSKQPPKKKRKVVRNTVHIDYYKLHWTKRLASREFDIYPVIKQRRGTAMKRMDIEAYHNDYLCFIDRDCEAFPISQHITSPSLNIHPAIASTYRMRRKRWLKSKKKNANGGKKDCTALSRTDSVLLSAMCSYRDVLFCDQHYLNDAHIKALVTQHVLSHILRNQDVHEENNIKLGSHAFIETDENDDEIRDSGFHKLSVLIVTPFRENVRKFGDQILSNLPKERRFKNERYRAFVEEYGADSGEKPQGRGAEFSYTFSGNVDDDFWCGISIGAKSVCFQQNWSCSDIVLISPLRLKLIFDSGRTADGRSVFDFFSSIEILMLDACDVLQMQNIQHLFDTLHKLNWHPKLKKQVDIEQVNFNRLRYCYIDDVAQFYRQNIVCCKHQTPQIKQLFEKRALNVDGRIKIQSNKCAMQGVLQKVVPCVKQQFIRFAMEEDMNESRLQNYTKYVLPLLDKTQKTLIFVSSYYDFLRLRRLYKSVKSMRFVSEYTAEADQCKYRKEFRDEANQNVMYLVITERYYFYKRIKCDGAHCVVFYSLPQNKEYYYHILNWFDTKKQYQSYALYAKNYDNLALQRIVGLKRMIKMLHHKNKNQVFV